MKPLDGPRTVLLLGDLQNDFLHAEGAYGRAGQGCEEIAALPRLLKPVAASVRRAGGWIISSHFTLIPGKNDEPFISPHLKKLRPFLGKGDFAPGGFGHDLVDELQPADLTVEKVAFSAFYQSRLEWLLARTRCTTVIFAGIVTNGGVASTVRDAHVRDYRCIVLSDGCAAFTPEIHAATVKSLSTIATIATCDEITTALS